jgi:hypothetical protein
LRIHKNSTHFFLLNLAFESIARISEQHRSGDESLSYQGFKHTQGRWGAHF